MNKSNKYKTIIISIVVIVFIVGVSCLKCKCYSNYLYTKSNKEINQRLTYVYNKVKNATKEVKKTAKIQKLEAFQKENTEVVALLEIKGTNINYPVLQSDNNSYYMTHNYKKKKSKDGSLFLDKDYDWGLPSTNLLIYGHNNIGSTEMFVELAKYKKESFYNKHKIINFTTNEEEAQYEIISVFLSKVYYKYETDVFRYYYFINANNKSEFDDYVNNCKKASLYDIEATAQYGDNLMTLSTCEYSKINGRLVVVARKITN